MRGTQLLIYFSELFPKQYYDQFQKEMRSPQTLLGQSTVYTEVTDGGSVNASATMKRPMQNYNIDLYWSKEYVMAANEFLQN